MSTIFIFHGLGGTPEENWFPWLCNELEKRGHKVIAPAFPKGEGHTLSAWLATFSAHEDQITKDSIFVGHSMAPAFILKLLETHPAKAAFFVAGFVGPLGLPNFDSRNASFTERDFDWESIRAHCPHFEIFASDNDPYVPLAKAEELSQLLSTPVTLVKGAEHFNAAAGYTEFEELLKEIGKLTK